MKMVTKKVQIEFASPRINAIDAITDIRKAAENASMNLNFRYDVQLQYPMPEGDKVTVEIRIPSDMADNFSYGNRLRGISAYLLKYCDGKYNQYLVGNRLLTYTEVPVSKSRENVDGVNKKLEAMSNFALLLERTDDVAEKKIKRVIRILNEDE